MDTPPRQLVRNIFHFASGEFVARIFSVAVVILLGHLYGVVILGVIAFLPDGIWPRLVRLMQARRSA